jgi:hypothetical protein
MNGECCKHACEFSSHSCVKFKCQYYSWHRSTRPVLKGRDKVYLDNDSIHTENIVANEWWRVYCDYI